MPEQTTITVTVAIGGRELIRRVDGTHWARDQSDRLYVYDNTLTGDGEDTTVLEVAGEHVIEVAREDAIDTLAVVDRADDAVVEASPTNTSTDTDSETDPSSETDQCQ